MIETSAPPKSITLTLPRPVSANLYWRTFLPRGHTRPIVTLSEQAKDYKAQVKLIARQAGVTHPLKGRVELIVEMYPERPLDWVKRARKDPYGWDDDVRSIDLDNALKVVIDAIKDVVISDDKWVRRIVASRMEPDGPARLVVTATTIVPPPPMQIAIALPTTQQLQEAV